MEIEWAGNEVREVGGENFGAKRRGLKNPWVGEEDVFLVHPQNGLNDLILNWCYILKLLNYKDLPIEKNLN